MTHAYRDENGALDLERARRILDGEAPIDTAEIREEIGASVVSPND